MKSTSSSTSKSHTRCRHLSPSGRQCSQPVCSSSSAFCFTHKPAMTPNDKLLLQELTQAAASMASPEDVSRVLSKIFVALLQDRIPLKKAGTLGFLGQMLLRSHREIEYYKKNRRQNEKEAEAAERHRLFFKEQDERRARIEARDAELRRTAAEQAAQAAREATKKAAAAAKAARKEAREAAKHRSAAAPPNAECGTPAALFSANQSKTTSKEERPNHPVIQSQNSSSPIIPVIPSTASPHPSVTPPPPQPDLNHFYPIDPTLPPGRQDLSKNIPPPDAEELRWRQVSRQFARSRRRY